MGILATILILAAECTPFVLLDVHAWPSTNLQVVRRLSPNEREDH